MAERLRKLRLTYIYHIEIAKEQSQEMTDNRIMATLVTDLLGGERVFGGAISSLDLVRATREGLPVEAAAALLSSLDTDKLRGLSSGESLRLTREQSDTLVRIAGMFAKAIDVLGDRAKAVHWLAAPNRALGGEAPLDLLDTSAGEHEVEALLDRIEYGVYS